jgi:predicted nucleic acid-binding protein
MFFTDLAHGDAVFVDANSLVYHFEPHPTYGPACNQLVARIESQDLLGFTATHILTGVAHRLMMVEASRLPGWTPTNVKQRLQRQPATIQKLAQFRTALETILNSRLRILSIAPALIVAAAIVSQQTGLLSNDALLIAVMQANGLTRLASNDTDFDRVPGITRYAPA